MVLFDQEVLAKQITKLLKLSNLQDGISVLRAIEAQHGLLIERADELWSFSHLTFQEYFTVQWLVRLSPEQLAEKIADHQWQAVVQQLVKSQPVDGLLRLIKRAIDYSVAEDAKAQELLTWVQEKTESVNTPYKPTAIKSFYFALVLALSLDLDLDLARNLNRARSLSLSLARALDCTCALDLARALSLSLDRDLDLARDLDLDFDLGFDYNSTLANQLQQLRVRLPEDFSEQNLQSFRSWWLSNGQDWIKALRQAMIDHLNISYNCQFTEAQEQALERYYDANKFLVKLLRDNAVSEAICQEIENHILLPIVTLQRCLPEMYSRE